MQFRFPRLTPTVKKLLIFLGAAFVVLAVLQNVVRLPVGLLALDLNLDAAGPGSAAEVHYLNLVWQPFTYWIYWDTTSPSTLIGFALALLFVYFFLAPFEESFGAKRTVQLIAVGVVSAAIGTLALAFALKGLSIHLAASSKPIYGAAPIALAGLGAFPIIARGAEIYFMFLIRMKAWHAVLAGLGIAALMAVLDQNPFIFAEEAAALGGGVLFATWLVRPRKPKKAAPKKRRSSGPDLKVVRGGGSGSDDDQPRWLN